MLGAVAALAVPAGAVPTGATAGLRLPVGTLRLTRRLERALRGDAQLVVTRNWSVRFKRQGIGSVVTGRQVSAKVDAPEAVAAFAKLEEQRSTDDMFPILLSDRGLILAAGDFVQVDDETRAIQMAREQIRERDLSGDSKSDQLRALAVLQRSFSSLLDQMPADLFFPKGEPVKRVRPVNLSDGIIGEFELTYEAQSSEHGDWLKRAERRIITRIGNSERRSREVWSMSPE